MVMLYKSPSAECCVPSSEFQNPKPRTRYLVFGDFSYLQNVVYWIFNIQFWQLILGTQYLVICVIYEMLYSGFRRPELGTWNLIPGTQYLMISSLYKIPGTQYLLPGSWYLLRGTQYSILGTLCSVLGKANDEKWMLLLCLTFLTKVVVQV
jgi:hypothetical protein